MREGDISHYHVLEKLGEGAMGEVYRAEDTRLKRTVALKFLAADRVTDAGLRKRFLHEAQAAASLDHPSICTVYEIDEQDGEIFIAMAYIDGPTLQKKIAQRPMHLEKAVEIAIQVGGRRSLTHCSGLLPRCPRQPVRPSAGLDLIGEGHGLQIDHGDGIARV
jgi:serine/threonine protein kinase